MVATAARKNPAARKKAPKPVPVVVAATAKLFTTVRLSEVWSSDLRLDAGSYSIQGRRATDELRAGRLRVTPLFGPDGLCQEAHNAFRFRRIYVSADRGVPFLSSSDIIRLDEPTGYYLSTKLTKGLDRLLIKKWDVLITCSGTIGNVSLAGDTLAGKALSQDAIRLRHADPDVAGFITAFLRSSFGRAQLVSASYGSVIPHIEPHHLARVLIPDPNPLLLAQIGEPMRAAVRNRDEANRLIAEAKRLLLDRLGLPPFEEFSRSNAERRTSVVRRSALTDRLDAGYHGGLVTAVESRLAKVRTEFAPLGDQRVTEEIRAITTFRTRVYVDTGGIPFLQSRQLFQFDPIDVKQLSKTAHAKHRSAIALRENMLVLNRSGRVSIGHVQIVPKYMDGWAGSEHVIRVIAAPGMNPGYLFAWLGSGYGQELVRRHDYGSVVPTIDKEMLASVAVPLAPPETREEVGNLVLKANRLRDAAWQLERGAIGKLESLISSRSTNATESRAVALAKDNPRTRELPFPTSDENPVSVDDTAREFRRLADDWRANRRPTSSAVKMAGHPAYRRIIEMGKADPETVVPLLLAELERTPDHWFVALHAITGADPVPPASRGRIKEMAASWVRWGKDNGFGR